MQIIDNFQSSFTKYLDDRQKWDNLTTLQSNTDIKMPKGFLAFCSDENKWYILDCTDENDTSTYVWTEFTTGSGSSSVSLDKWKSGKLYHVNDLAVNNTILYICTVEHTSSDFDTEKDTNWNIYIGGGSSSGALSAGDQAKLDKIVIDGDGTGYLTNDGTYKVIPEGNMTAEEKEKIGFIITNGDGSKILTDNGSYIDKEVSDKDRQLLDLLLITGDGTQYYCNDGTFKPVPDELSADDRSKLDMLSIDSNGDAKLFLAQNGTYKHMELDPDDRVKLDMIVTNGSGSFFLADNGAYVEMHATFTEEEYKKLQKVTDGIILFEQDENGNDIIPDGTPEKTYLSSYGTFDKLAEPYEVMTEDEVTAMMNEIFAEIDGTSTSGN